MRALLAALVAATVLSPVPATAAPSSMPDEGMPYGGTYQAAEATWIVRRHGRLRMFNVLAYSMSGARRQVTAVLVGSGPCRLRAGRRLDHASCSVRHRIQRVEPSAFAFDPGLTGASLTVGRLRIQWQGRGIAEPQESIYREPGFLDADLEVARPGTAWGRAAGRRFPRGRRAWIVREAQLAHGVYAGGQLPL